MKKEKKVVYGIEITKPWSLPMYVHNDRVADEVRGILLTTLDELTIMADNKLQGYCWGDLVADSRLKKFQKTITLYGFGSNYEIDKVLDIVRTEIEDAPYYRLKEIAEDLELDLKQGFVGFD
jgi:hypothetical protein